MSDVSTPRAEATWAMAPPTKLTASKSGLGIEMNEGALRSLAS
ncbi:MAG: hypothetical protein P8M25_01405 [Paracoccaceae bacterium]|nr:hypothetical protein [Paracoccaceae bacterium]